MTTVGLISEFNPFHNGHKLLFEKIKEIFGKDTVIVCAMSGNYVQRGECAVIDKFERARIAVEMGASLVLEIPFPYSSSSAEIFAKAGVGILNSINKIDYLVFGAEDSDTNILSKTAENMLSDNFSSALSQNLKEKELKNLGYAQIFEKTYEMLFTNSKDFDIIRKANNILAIEYIKALKLSKSEIIPYAIKREGSIHGSCDVSPICSACAIRNKLFESDIVSVKDSMPKESFDTLLDYKTQGKLAQTGNLFLPFMQKLRFSSADDFSDVLEFDHGLAQRIIRNSKIATNYSELIELSKTKKYTDAKIRRALLFALINIKKKQIKKSPAFTRVLASDEHGLKILHNSKNSRLNILTKGADIFKLSDDAKEDFSISNRADSTYSLSKTHIGTHFEFISHSPYIKKCKNSTTK